jgi:putative transposase
MRENRLAACVKKAFRPRTTLPGGGAAPNLIKGLEPTGVNQVWVSDITYIATLEGWLYLAGILDLFSRKVVGWKLGETLAAELVVTALENALTRRTPDRGLYFHSDRGSQSVRKPLSMIGANLRMSGLGNCYDNAKAEAFFSTLKSECLPANQVFEFLSPRRLRAESCSSISKPTTITNVFTVRWVIKPLGNSRRSFRKPRCGRSARPV